MQAFVAATPALAFQVMTASPAGAAYAVCSPYGETAASSIAGSKRVCARTIVSLHCFVFSNASPTHRHLFRDCHEIMDRCRAYRGGCTTMSANTSKLTRL